MNETHYTVYYRHIYTYYICIYVCIYMYICTYVCVYTKSAFQLTNVGHNKAYPNYLQATRVHCNDNEVLVAAIQM